MLHVSILCCHTDLCQILTICWTRDTMPGAGGFSTLSLKDMTRSGPTLCRVRKTSISSYYPQIKRVMPMRFRWLPFPPCLFWLLTLFISAFFVATQFFYTLSFIAILVAIILVMMYLLCVDEYYRVSVLKWTGIDLIVAGELNQVMDISPILLQLLLVLEGRFFKELLWSNTANWMVGELSKWNTFWCVF